MILRAVTAYTYALALEHVCVSRPENGTCLGCAGIIRVLVTSESYVFAWADMCWTWLCVTTEFEEHPQQVSSRLSKVEERHCNAHTCVGRHVDVQHILIPSFICNKTMCWCGELLRMSFEVVSTLTKATLLSTKLKLELPWAERLFSQMELVSRGNHDVSWAHSLYLSLLQTNSLWC